MWGVGPSHFLLWASVSTPKWAGVVGALPCPLKPGVDSGAHAEVSGSLLTSAWS